MGREVLGPGGVWGRVQGVGSDHWGTRSQPWGRLRMGWPLKARRSLFPDWLWLCDESSSHRRALHIPVQILAGKFKTEFLPTISLTKAFPAAQIRPNLQKSFPAADFIQVWTNLWYRECFCKTNCWQDLHFEFCRQNLNRNVQSPSMWWWLITQPKPIWKKAPPGLQRPSHTESSSGLTSSTPMVRTHTLNPTPDAPPGPKTPPSHPIIN